MNGIGGIVKRFANFVAHDLGDALDIATEAHWISLNIDRTDFFDEIAENRILFV